MHQGSCLHSFQHTAYVIAQSTDNFNYHINASECNVNGAGCKTNVTVIYIIIFIHFKLILSCLLLLFVNPIEPKQYGV